jgi:hypothetical protein
LHFVSVFFFKIVNHGNRRGNMAQALAQWQHLVALHEATDVLHQAMRPALHRRICMAIEIASVYMNFLSSLILLFATTNHELKTMLWL